MVNFLNFKDKSNVFIYGSNGFVFLKYIVLMIINKLLNQYINVRKLLCYYNWHIVCLLIVYENKQSMLICKHFC